MVESLYKKGLVLGIIVLFVGVAIAPVAGNAQIMTAKYNNASSGITWREKSAIHREGTLDVPDEFVVDVIQQINEALYLGYLENITAFGPRVTESAGCQQAGEYIYNEFQSMGLEVRYHYWSGWGASDRNIEATLSGTDETSDEIYIICAHHDTVADSPGADDDGSGVAAVLSAAYVLSQHPFNHTIRFITFSGEEQGMSGSLIYAEEAADNGDNIIAVLNADMIGFATTSEHGKKIVIFEGPDEQWITDFTINVNEAYYDYIHLDDIIREDYYLGDDEAFWQYGYTAICYQEYEFNYYYHTPYDNISNMNITYAMKCTKLILATLTELAEHIIIGNPPQVPTISGPTVGFIDQEVNFTIVTVDPDDDNVYYKIDWDDGNNSEGLGPYPSGTLVNVSHVWTMTGEYQIKVIARDINHGYSDWSEPLTIHITNDPPDAPSIDGPPSGVKNQEYVFSFVSWDWENHMIMYRIDWRDGYGIEETEYYANGTVVNISHSWANNGLKTIKAQAVDEHGLESDWSTFPFSVPRDKVFNFKLLELLFTRFPNMFPILQKLLQRLGL